MKVKFEKIIRMRKCLKKLEHLIQEEIAKVNSDLDELEEKARKRQEILNKEGEIHIL